jgi:drug/metabolite transporter (DMT)-like permease
MRPSRVQLIAAFAAVYIIWGSTYLAIRYAVLTLPPFLLAGARFTIAGLILCAVAAVRGETRPTAPQWRSATIMGALLLLGGNGAVVWAEQTVPSGITALLVAIVPLWLVLLEWLRTKQRPVTGVLIGVLVGLAGMIELIGVDSLRGRGAVPVIGAIVLIVGSLSWAVGTLYGKTANLPRGLFGSGSEMLCGGLTLLVAAVVTGELNGFDVQAVSSTSLLAVLYLIAFGSLIAYTAYSWLVHNASPATIGTYAYVNPVVAVFLGWAIAGEPVTTQTLIGATIIVAAVALITTARSSRP